MNHTYLLHFYSINMEIAIHFLIRLSSQHMLIRIAFYSTIVDVLALNGQYRIHHQRCYHLDHQIQAHWTKEKQMKDEIFFYCIMCELHFRTIIVLIGTLRKREFRQTYRLLTLQKIGAPLFVRQTLPISIECLVFIFVSNLSKFFLIFFIIITFDAIWFDLIQYFYDTSGIWLAHSHTELVRSQLLWP